MGSRRVLITGATGFVGRWIRPALVVRDCEVIALSKLPAASDGDDIQWVYGDLLQHNSIHAAVSLARADTLIHTAWDTTPGSYWTTSRNLAWVSASLQLFESFIKNGGSRIVVAGTSAEYDWSNDADLTEGRGEHPNTLYGVCKDSLRRMTEQWAFINNVSWAWGRIFCPFGPHERKERLVPKLVSMLAANKTVPFDSGNLVRDFLDVRDLGDAFAALAISDVAGTINLASGQATSIRTVVQTLAEKMNMLDRVQFNTLPEPVGQPDRIVADIRRQTNELNWQPAASVHDRLIETCQWWENKIATQPKR